MKIKQLLLVLPLLLWSIDAFSSVRIAFSDQNGVPLPDTVVEVVLKNGKKAKLDNNQVYVMDQVHKAFLPHVLLVPKNSLVAFPNSDDIRHHVYSFSEVKPFELKLYSGQPKAPIMFEQAGVAVLGCNIHDAMVGYIYIYDEHHTYKSGAKGQVTLPWQKNDIEYLNLWHPRAEIGLDNKQKITIAELPQATGGKVEINIAVLPPESRDSFEDLFSNVQ